MKEKAVKIMLNMQTKAEGERELREIEGDCFAGVMITQDGDGSNAQLMGGGEFSANRLMAVLRALKKLEKTLVQQLTEDFTNDDDDDNWMPDKED